MLQTSTYSFWGSYDTNLLNIAVEIARQGYIVNQKTHDEFSFTPKNIIAIYKELAKGLEFKAKPLTYPHVTYTDTTENKFTGMADALRNTIQYNTKGGEVNHEINS